MRSNIAKFLNLGPSRTVLYTASPAFLAKMTTEGKVAPMTDACISTC